MSFGLVKMDLTFSLQQSSKCDNIQIHEVKVALFPQHMLSRGRILDFVHLCRSTEEQVPDKSKLLRLVLANTVCKVKTTDQSTDEIKGNVQASTEQSL